MFHRCLISAQFLSPNRLTGYLHYLIRKVEGVDQQKCIAVSEKPKKIQLKPTFFSFYKCKIFANFIFYFIQFFTCHFLFRRYSAPHSGPNKRNSSTYKIRYPRQRPSGSNPSSFPWDKERHKDVSRPWSEPHV